jgi:hypothetical protein
MRTILSASGLATRVVSLVCATRDTFLLKSSYRTCVRKWDCPILPFSQNKLEQG